MRLPIDTSALNSGAGGAAKPVIDFESTVQRTHLNAVLVQQRVEQTACDAAGQLLLRTNDVAALLTIGRTKVYELINSGDIRSVKIGGLRRVLRSDLENFLSKLV